MLQICHPTLPTIFSLLHCLQRPYQTLLTRRTTRTALTRPFDDSEGYLLAGGEGNLGPQQHQIGDANLALPFMVYRVRSLSGPKPQSYRTATTPWMIIRTCPSRISPPMHIIMEWRNRLNTSRNSHLCFSTSFVLLYPLGLDLSLRDDHKSQAPVLNFQAIQRLIILCLCCFANISQRHLFPHLQ